MSIEQFVGEIVKELNKKTGLVVKEHRARKNNGVIFTGVTIIEPGCSVAPTLYVDAYWNQYMNGRSFEQIIDELLERYKVSRIDSNVDIHYFMNYENVKNHIVYKLVNYESNVEELKTRPHKKYLDLAIVFYYIMNNDSFPDATVQITNAHINVWGIDVEELFTVATKNTPDLLKASFKGMSEVMMEIALKKGIVEITEEEVQDVLRKIKEEKNIKLKDDYGMYVLNNQTKMCGAVSMLYEGVLSDIAERLDSNFYILPSSIHELILIDADICDDVEHLKEMVQQVNDTELEKTEILSYNVYHYDRAIDEITIA